jgi:hypothetical protein
MTSVLSQQAVQHPGMHTDVLAQIESRLAKNRAFYASIRDANEEIAEALPSKQLKQRGEASVRPVSLDYLTVDTGFPSFLRLLENHGVDLEASPRACREDLTRCEEDSPRCG